MASKSGLENILRSVVDVVNKEQNQQVPPSVFDSWFNAVTSFLIDNLVKIYPLNAEILIPFLATEKIAVTNGYVQFPDDKFRDFLSASINVKPDGSDCSDVPMDKAQFEASKLKGGCKTRPITLVDRNKWDWRVTSTYAFPTIEDPIGIYIGDNRLKVCPYNLPKVELNYVKKEKLYRYGYIMQPDDTYIFNKNTSTESEWGDNAFSYLFKGCLALASDYLRDNQLREASAILNERGLF